LYATDGTEYTEALTGCQSTQTITGLVSHWKFDEGTGTTAYDSIGTNHGTLTNGPTWKTSADCISGGCLQFDGVDDYVSLGSLGSATTVNKRTDWTLSIWMKPQPGVKVLFSEGVPATIFNIATTPNNGVSIAMWNKDLPSHWQFLGSDYNILEPNKWNHILISFSDGNNNPIMNLWVNGHNRSIVTGTPIKVDYDGNTISAIGAAVNTTYGYYYNGLIDNPRLYERFISSDEVLSIFDLGRSYYEDYGLCGNANGSRLSSSPTNELCSYGTPSLVSGSGPWTWVCSGSVSSTSCQANPVIDGVCGGANGTEMADTSINLCTSGTPSAVTGDGVPYTWDCVGRGGSTASCKGTKTGWIDTGLGFYIMKYQAKIQGNSNGNQTYSSAFVPESRASGTPWVRITQTNAISECQSLGSGYHLITNAEWTSLARHIASQSSNWSTGTVGSGSLSRGYSASTTFASDGFTNTVPAPLTGAGYEYNTGANTVGSSGNFILKRTHKLANGQIVWDLAGNVWEWTNNTCTQGSGTSKWSSITSWIEWNGSDLNDYERPTAGPNPLYTSSQNAGKYYGCSANGNGFVRGGTWFDGNRVGLFAIHMADSPSFSGTATGFRCTR
jgi:formylglycine-generating enzyme required for sulfatase activity